MKPTVTLVLLSLILTACGSAADRKSFSISVKAVNNSDHPMRVLLNLHEGSSDQSCAKEESTDDYLVPAKQTVSRSVSLDCVAQPDQGITYYIQDGNVGKLTAFNAYISAPYQAEPLPSLLQSGMKIHWDGNVSGRHDVEISDINPPPAGFRYDSSDYGSSLSVGPEKDDQSVSFYIPLSTVQKAAYSKATLYPGESMVGDELKLDATAVAAEQTASGTAPYSSTVICDNDKCTVFGL